MFSETIVSKFAKTKLVEFTNIFFIHFTQELSFRVATSNAGLMITGMLIIIGFKLSESPDMIPVVVGCSHSCYVVGDGSCWLVCCWFEDLLSH